MIPVRLENLSKRFVTPRGMVLAVDNVDLRIQGGELFFLLGPSGCGKTTLLRMLAGFVQPSGGRIFFGEREVTNLPPERRDSAMVFQNYALWPHMSVAKNVSFGLEVRHVERARRRQVVAELLKTVRIAEKAQAKPMELSGGQQQRVALARALAVQPSCLLLDEPLSNLDAALRAAMRWEIRRVVKQVGTTAVYVTHDQAEALAIADRIALLRDGRIIQTGTGRQLYESPANRFVAGFLGEANFLPATVAGREYQLLVLDSQAGRVLGRAGGEFSIGQAVTCCIRPENVRIAGADLSAVSATTNNLAAAPGDKAPTGAATGDVAVAPKTTGSPSGPATILPARLTEWTHLGESARFRVRLAGGGELSGAVMPAAQTAAIGMNIHIRLAANDVLVLPDS